jgi:hypothetical protein
VAALVALPAGFVLVLLGRWPMVQAVETGRTPEYPYLQPATYPELPVHVFEAARRAIERMQGWTLVGTEPDEGILRAHVVSSPFGFTSEVTVMVRRIEGVTRVSVRSEIPAGRERLGDFGQNARNVRQVLRELRLQMDRSAAPARE